MYLCINLICHWILVLFFTLWPIFTDRPFLGINLKPNLLNNIYIYIMNEQEEIKPIEGFPKYFISNTGKIYTEYLGERKVLKPRNHKTGYKYAGIYIRENDKSKRYWLRIHRLVYSHFVGKLNNDLCINHIDANKGNNHYSNLEQITYKENIQKYWKQRKENEKNKIG